VSWKERKVVVRDLKAIYRAPTLEAANAQLRKVTKPRGAFPTPDSVRKVLYLAIMKASERWSRPVQDRTAALNHLSIAFEGRIPV
jgi:putative transposase